jgi:hypothetical protein
MGSVMADQNPRNHCLAQALCDKMKLAVEPEALLEEDGHDFENTDIFF